MAFAAYFILLWLFVGALLSQLSGWPRLAERFRVEGVPSGRLLGGQVVAVGWVNENNVTNLIIGPEGLCLKASLLFRFRRPTLLVPWPYVRYVSQRKVLWWKSFLLDLGDVTTLRIREAAFQEAKPYIVRGSFGPSEGS